MNNLPSPTSDYIQYLPAILQADPFLQRFLLAFEQILTGTSLPSGQCPGLLKPQGQNPAVGLETVLDEIQTYFNPQQTPAEFLPWLAGWVALSLRDDWDEATKRAFVQQIVPLYRLRGTREGLRRILSLYLRSASITDKVEIFEDAAYPAHYFQVQLTLPRKNQSDYWRQVRIARAIIEQEKPAHTYYALRILTPTMRLTGNRYALTGTTAAGASVQVTASVADAPPNRNDPPPPTPWLRVSIKAVDIPDPLATQVAQVAPGTSITVSAPTTLPARFAASTSWYVLIDNLSSTEFKGTLTVTAGGGTPSPISIALTLEPGLRLIKKQTNGSITDANGNTDGNTRLGTQVGEI